MSDLKTNDLLLNSTKYEAVGDRTKAKILNITIGLLLIAYGIITIIPFYFLIVRSFVPTTESIKLQLWIPKAEQFDMDSKFGNVSVFYNLDTKKFKEIMGIEGYLAPYSTFNQIAEKYNISKEKIKGYIQPYVRFNGWMLITKDSRFIKSLSRTAFIALFSVFMGGLLSIATGSVLARFRRKWHMFVYNTYMVQMVIPPVMVMLPLYDIVNRQLGLYDNYLALILAFIQGGALPIMIFTGFIASIPVEIEESVMIDGGNRFKHYFHILLPLCKTPFATYMVIRLPKYWNDMLYGLLFLKPGKYTLIPMLNTLNGTYTTNFQAQFAGLCMSLIPVFILYLVFQKLFVQSALSGAVKG